MALAALSWGTTGTSLKLAAATAGALPLIAGASRLAVAAPLLAAAAATRSSLRQSGWEFLPAGACIAAYQLLYFSAVPRAGVAATALLAICSAPILVAALARLLLGERLGPRRIAALVMGTVGGGLLVGGASGSAPAFGAGAALALGAGLAYSVYVVTTKRAAGRERPGALAAVTFATAAALLLPVLALQPGSTVALWRHAWPYLVYLGAVPTAAAYGLYTSGLRRIGAAPAAVAGLLEPLGATALGIVLFGEHLGAVGWLGAALLILAVALLGVSTPES